MNTPNYEIDPKDPRLQAVENEENAALISSNTAYDNMINSSDTHYNAQIQAAKDYETTQKANQQAQTDLTVQKINQQKQQAHSDYVKEQSAAYADWQKQSNKYGVNAEQQAQMGMTNTGYSESSQVSMYNTYQNRVAVGRDNYNRAIQNYDNSINEAKLQNNALLAEIAYSSLQKQLELAIDGFNHKNSLIIEKANREMEIKKTYQGFYQDVLAQINKENTLTEEVRQFNENMAFKREQLDETNKREQLDETNNKYTFKDGGPGFTEVDGSGADANDTVYAFFDEMVKAGASKVDIKKEINRALIRGEITWAEAKELKEKYASKR